MVESEAQLLEQANKNVVDGNRITNMAQFRDAQLRMWDETISATIKEETAKQTKAIVMAVKDSKVSINSINDFRSTLH